MKIVQKFQQNVQSQYFTQESFKNFLIQQNQQDNQIFEDIINPTSNNFCVDTHKGKYQFIQYKICNASKNKKILNLKYLNKFYPEIKDYPIYQEQQQSIKELQDVELLGIKIKKIITKIKAQHFSEDGLKVDYKNIDLQKNEFQQLIVLLCFIKYNQLVQNKDLAKAFFINIYNIMNLHILINYFVENKSKKDVSLFKKLKFFSDYYYNIGGYNFSLNDIEHGILRQNDNFKGNILCFAKFYILGKDMSDRSKLRFDSQDQRNIIVQKLDPRIHFALNCGQLSCPPILAYDSKHINDQLEKAAYSFINNETKIEDNKLKVNQIFQFYSSDFGDLKKFISKYKSDVDAQQLENLKIQYEKYNTSTNVL